MSTAMRLLIHYVGDVHQPLHATSRVDKKYPKGDRGGNDFPLPNTEGIKELHAIWDSVLLEFSGYANLPFSDDDWDSHSDNATRLFNKHEVTDAEANDLDPKSWAHESYLLSRDFVYALAKENTKLSDDYIKRGNDISEKRIVQAGHRLYHLLRSFNLVNKDYMRVFEKDELKRMNLVDKVSNDLGFLQK